jgi:hypothetical protein
VIKSTVEVDRGGTYPGAQEDSGVTRVAVGQGMVALVASAGGDKDFKIRWKKQTRANPPPPNFAELSLNLDEFNGN